MSGIVSRLRTAGCVFAEEEAAILRSSASTDAELTGLVNRRIDGEPLEYVVGWARFHGQRIRIDDGVFIPRRRTEFLVDVALAVLGGKTSERPIVLDLCCGSGAVGAALQAALPQIELYAADIDARAAACARRNVAARRVFTGDLYAPLPRRLRQKVRLIVANTPYVPTDDIRLLPREARLHEPRGTLDGGADGLDIQRRLAAGALAWLAPGGTLAVEASTYQAPQTAQIFSANRMDARIEHSEKFDATVVVGTLRP